MADPNAALNAVPGALALISEGHRVAVVAHPEWLHIAQNLHPALQLAWMVDVGLLTYDELDDLHSLAQEPLESDRLVEEAFGALVRQDALINRPPADQAPLN